MPRRVRPSRPNRAGGAPARSRYLATATLEIERLWAKHSYDRLPWNLSLRMSLSMRMSMRCCGIRPCVQRARGYAPAVGSYARSAPTGNRSNPAITLRSRHRNRRYVPEIIGQDAETAGHVFRNTHLD